MSVADTISGQGLVVDHATATGTVRALHCDRVDVAAGESLAIMGPSGCGKSTLLGVLAGLSRPTRGTVVIGDTDVTALAKREQVRFRRQTLGMVYQADNLLPHLTVEENIGIQLAISGTPDHRDDTPMLLDRLGLSTLAHRFPDQLSGGQRQRVAVARAIVHRPSVILADEPTGALDSDSAQQVIDLLNEVHREISASLVVVTHDPQIASRLDRAIRLDLPARTPESDHAG